MKNSLCKLILILTCVGAMFIMASCSKNASTQRDVSEVPESFSQLSVPKTFNWSTTQQVAVNLDISQPHARIPFMVTFLVVEDSTEESLLVSEVAELDGTFSKVLTIGQGITELKLQVVGAGGRLFNEMVKVDELEDYKVVFAGALDTYDVEAEVEK